MNKYTKTGKFCLLAFIAVLTFSCGNKKGINTAETFNLKEEKLPYTVTCSKSPEDTIQALSDDLTNQLLRDFKKYEGNKMKIQSPIPEDWGVEYKLTPMSSDFDIWIISNTGYPTHKFLATVNTASEIPFVIQAIPIAYNMGIEKPNFIESEQWNALIKDDYKIIVTKTYEKIYSLIDTLASNHESIYTKTEDIYNIENNGKITYEIPPSFNIDYRTIIQFADTASTGNILDESWIWNSIEIQEVIESMNILFVTATTNFDKLSIYNYRGDEVDIIDISPYLDKHNMGYLAIKKGEKPLFIPYSSSKECLQKALKYFDVDYPQLETNEELIN